MNSSRSGRRKRKKSPPERIQVLGAIRPYVQERLPGVMSRRPTSASGGVLEEQVTSRPRGSIRGEHPSGTDGGADGNVLALKRDGKDTLTGPIGPLTGGWATRRGAEPQRTHRPQGIAKNFGLQ